ncbi:hypothetical protein HPP92_024853 [Vanilla planifolia]|uniref:Uncharacterized protein n=1 Tax=Vanilla planifolia TaxID=51239 RepID=A0A835U8G9_VANPL|nr:hypothetical protein HPP92_024853 [Vanilla planifolia]
MKPSNRTWSESSKMEQKRKVVLSLYEALSSGETDVVALLLVRTSSGGSMARPVRSS